MVQTVSYRYIGDIKLRLRSFSIKGFYGCSFEHGLNFPEIGNITVLIGPNNSGKSIPTRVFSMLGYMAVKSFGLCYPRAILVEGQPNSGLLKHLGRKIRYQQKALPMTVNIQVDCPDLNSDNSVYMPIDQTSHKNYVDIDYKFWLMVNQEIIIANPLLEIRKYTRCRSLRDTPEPSDNGYLAGIEQSGEPYYSHVGGGLEPHALVAAQFVTSRLKDFRFFEAKRDIQSSSGFKSFDPILNPNNDEIYREGLLKQTHINGSEVLERLAALQNSDETAEQLKLQRIAAAINEIVTPGGSIGFKRLNITDKSMGERKLQFISESGEVTSFENTGTGISALVILLAELLLNETASVYFLEEPEQHLHPGLLARVFHFLKVQCTMHQFIVSTHSNTLLDCLDSDDRVYRLKQTADKGCVAELCSTFSDYHTLFDSLGIRASSLMLVNNVVWVEGPSDVTYLRFWLSQYRFGPEGKQALTENSDFAFVMYGGSCISYLCAEEEEEPDKLSILRLCRRAILIADKDSDNEDERKVHVERLAAEFEGIPGRKLITTANREIENDVDTPTLIEALKLTFTKSLKDFPFEELKPDNTARLPELIEAVAMASNFKIRIKQGRNFSDTFDDAKARLANNVVKLLRKQDSVTVPGYIKELAEFILEGRAPDAAVSRSNGVNESITSEGEPSSC